MFEDNNVNQAGAQVPSNLPIGEPEDMFAGVEKDDAPVPPMNENEQAPVQPPVEEAATALGAGILKPKQETTQVEQQPTSMVKPDIPITSESNVPSGMPANTPPPSNPNQGNDIYTVKEPALAKGLIKLIIAAVVVVILGGGSWWIYSSFIMDTNTGDSFDLDTTGQPTSDFINQPVGTNVVEPAVTDIQPADDLTDVSVVEDTDITSEIVDDQVLFGEPIDKDGDGLDDIREKDINTDPNNWDSDNDLLSDGDEVTIWKTDPLNPDSDGDSFEDGVEVRNGYNPAGPGKIFEPPQEDEE